MAQPNISHFRFCNNSKVVFLNILLRSKKTTRIMIEDVSLLVMVMVVAGLLWSK